VQIAGTVRVHWKKMEKRKGSDEMGKKQNKKTKFGHEIRKRRIIWQILKERCNNNYNADFSCWKRYYYTAKTILLVILNRKEPRGRDLASESGNDPVIIAGFNFKSRSYGDLGNTDTWDQLDVYRDLSYYTLEGQEYDH
jgi:hypothetical protein